MRTKKKLSGIIAGLAAVLAAVSLTACGQKENAADAQPADTKVAEQPTEATIPEVQGDVEETAEVSEDPTANLSNEEWVRSLNLEKGTFFIFNDIAGERKVLEDGQEYQLQEGDNLALLTPTDWKLSKVRPMLYTPEVKYGCFFMNLERERMEEKTEMTANLKDPDGNDVSITVYLCK